MFPPPPPLTHPPSPSRPLANPPSRRFWTSGNHELYQGIETWRGVVADNNIVNVENAHFVHKASNIAGFDSCGADASVNFVGLADTQAARNKDASQYVESEFIVLPDLSGAMAGLGTELGVTIGKDDSVPTVILNHTPVDFEKNGNAGDDLQLSGHTHGGHVFPFHLFTAGYDGTSGIFEKRLGAGKNTYLYVSEGVVGWGPRVRLFSRPEITIITLMSGAAQPEGDTHLRVGQAFVYVAIALVLPTIVLLCWSAKASYAKRQKGRMKRGI